MTVLQMVMCSQRCEIGVKSTPKFLCASGKMEDDDEPQSSIRMAISQNHPGASISHEVG